MHYIGTSNEDTPTILHSKDTFGAPMQMLVFAYLQYICNNLS